VFTAREPSGYNVLDAFVAPQKRTVSIALSRGSVFGAATQLVEQRPDSFWLIGILKDAL
jgi:hypothetical protein